MTTLDKKETGYGISVPSGTAAGMYRYNVYRNYSDLSANGELVFCGNFYYNGTSAIVGFNVIDIARSLKYTSNIEAEVNCQPAKLVQYFRIIAYFGQTSVTSSWYPIAMVYQYPNFKSYTDPETVYISGYGNEHSVPLQGLYADGSGYMLVPHYPLMETHSHMFTQSFITTSDTTNFNINVYSSDIPGDLTVTLSSIVVDFRNPKRITYLGTVTSDQVAAGYFADYEGADHPIRVTNVQTISQSVRITFDEELPNINSINFYEPISYSDTITINSPYPSDTMSRTFTCFLGDFVDFGESEKWGDGNLFVADESSGVDIAILDNCYKRYYLMWQDRLGGWQSQAFNDKMTYSEDITNSETKDYGNERHKSQVTVQPKWKLNSNWITEDVFPLYESIFISPELLLFDTVENKTYKVICKGNFTEKKYKNEKKLLSLSLDLESTMQQNIIY